MKKAIIVIIIAVVVIGGGVVAAVMLNKPASTTIKTPTTSTPTSTASSIPATNGTTQSITVTANDESASPETINVTKGDTVNLTFDVSSAGTYHGGLDFKSDDPAIDSGSIAEGASKTVTFTATTSFKFTPFWYQSNVQKDYFVTVNVQ